MESLKARRNIKNFNLDDKSSSEANTTEQQDFATPNPVHYNREIEFKMHN